MKNVEKMLKKATLSVVTVLLLTALSYAQKAPKLSDAEVAHAAVTANQIDIDYAAIAKKKSKDEEVLKFAQTMSDDHRAVIKKATELVKKIGVSPKDNAESKALMERATKEKESLNALSGTAFDKAYIDNEVAFHKAVIHSVNTELLPHAKNSELKNFLTSIIPSLEAHLAHAEEIQKNFKDKP